MNRPEKSTLVRLLVVTLFMVHPRIMKLSAVVFQCEMWDMHAYWRLSCVCVCTPLP